MLLELEPDRQAGFEDPRGQLGRIDRPKAALKRTGQRSVSRCVADQLAAQSKSRRSQTTTLTSSIGLSRSRLLQTLASTSPEPGVLMIEDDAHTGIDRAGVDGPAGLEQDRLAGDRPAGS